MWDDVTRHLRNNSDGAKVGDVTAVDLPGHGIRRSFDISRITVDYYVNAVVTPPRVNLLEDVTLVAHSFAATFAPQVAKALGSVLSRIVFIGGMLPAKGAQPIDELSFLTKKSAGVFRLSEKGFKPLNPLLARSLYNDVGAAEASIRTGRLVPDPYQPWVTPMTALEFPDHVELTYVVLTNDKFLSAKQQRAYASRLSKAEVVEIGSGHMAPVVQPRRVAEILLEGVA
jgi:pimeloyl-ACP methyl ester carboxylesterase